MLIINKTKKHVEQRFCLTERRLAKKSNVSNLEQPVLIETMNQIFFKTKIVNIQFNTSLY